MRETNMKKQTSERDLLKQEILALEFSNRQLTFFAWAFLWVLTVFGFLTLGILFFAVN